MDPKVPRHRGDRLTRLPHDPNSPLTELPGLAVGDRVRIHALMKIETTPGGAVKTTYIAHAVYRLND
ncbi:hypothetical protein I548_0346 [Mycobacterium intracellulare]|nr:hypothetical protein I548_0346 [Mycobacterium intracellulare]